MTGLDSNILVQLALSDHPQNESTLTAVRAETAAGHRLALTSVATAEFLPVSADVRRFTPPLTMVNGCGNSILLENAFWIPTWPPFSSLTVSGDC